MQRMVLSNNDLISVAELISYLKEQYGNCCQDELIRRLRFYASFLPKSILSAVSKYKYDELGTGILMVQGIDGDIFPDTPASWDFPESYRPSKKVDFFAMLMSSCLGNVFAWSSQQKGKYIHDLIPRRGKGDSQTGYGSTSELIMHTEDSFHPCKADYLCIYGVRNIDGIATTLASIRDLSLSPYAIDILFEKRFIIVPDESHLDAQQSIDLTKNHADSLNTLGQKVGLLYGNKNFPWLCYDPAYTKIEVGDELSLMALNMLAKEIQRCTHKLAIGYGDFCIIDNRKVVHGRESFMPRFDGTDRWLKRINIACNIRKSAAYRRDINSMVIG